MEYMIKVRVYRNLHKDCWSVKYKGIVIARPKQIQLKNAKMIVNEKGRQKVLDKKQKQVHAYIEGYWNEKSNRRPSFIQRWKEISYNPYFKPFFFFVRGKKAILNAKKVFLTSDNKVFSI